VGRRRHAQRGFLIGGTSGRTTLNGEGLQHEDGHSHICSLRSFRTASPYDPTYAYELAVIVQDGLRRMYSRAGRRVLLHHGDERELPPSRDAGGAEDGILRGMYLLREGDRRRRAARATDGLRHDPARGAAAADLLASDFGVVADVWSATSFNELRRDGSAAERWNLLHPGEKPRSRVRRRTARRPDGPVVAATDYMKTYADQIRPFVERPFHALGTDGFGRSDTRA
jgi:pyruvate dehydrogenase E1 component